MISYKPLWRMMFDKNIKKMEFKEKANISNGTLSKLSKNEYVALAVIEKICLVFDCTPNDVIEIKKDIE
ncbi:MULTISPECIES: helix-turn-helix domain-containing protein [unclassified Clostridioides]|uniref:helix-turn-helix domain-containing protein n=1 Tax=unclassified Clostridioides TaxID=2635829 RepID=UPI001D0C2EF0|nr:helix-turn-helix transcriptional regulator [Clostridioides sp. ES-S-0001-03]MCC0679572.1 helix-turn-helix transcriptional regulator [Clostridioides sp. ES-S-0005-03]MCC0764043.1 helix-turn-helix transcriptional regulator [Clostridioides sp. ES-S-0006-03]UDN63785.1 helix-turn-helix transcriptional regulator [Clostridioides sp. ES-W-0016-02]